MSEILFIQGGGKDVHDAWDDQLVASLKRELGDGFDVRYPRMPDEDDPSFAKWAPAIRRAIAELGAGAVVVAHSLGAPMLIQALIGHRPDAELGAIVLVSAPFVGDGGWPGDEFELPTDLGARLPASVPVHIFHGSDDDTVPPAHADLYAKAIPQAEVHRLAGRDHQLANDLHEVAEVIREVGAPPP